VIPLLVAGVGLILLNTYFKGNKKVKTIVKRAVGEYTFMLLMYFAYLIAVSWALEAMFGAKNVSDGVGKVSVL
jgi:hypothetical protein